MAYKSALLSKTLDPIRRQYARLVWEGGAGKRPERNLERSRFHCPGPNT
jgi:hypothetical protein